MARRRQEQVFRYSAVIEAETPGDRKTPSGAGLGELDEKAVSLHQIDHGVKSLIHRDRVMSRSDAGNYRPLATHVEDAATRTLRLQAPKMRSNSSQRPPQLLLTHCL